MPMCRYMDVQLSSWQCPESYRTPPASSLRLAGFVRPTALKISSPLIVWWGTTSALFGMPPSRSASVELTANVPRARYISATFGDSLIATASPALEARLAVNPVEDARQRLFPRQGRPGETDRGFRHSLHHHPLDPVHGIPRPHRRHGCGWKRDQDFARPVPTHRGGRCCRGRRGCGARGAAKRHRRDRRPGTSAVQRNRRPLPEGGRRPASGRERPRGPLLRRPGRGALARAVRRGAPRPHRSRRVASPLTGSSLMLHRRCTQGSHLLARAGPGRRTKEATMTIKLVALVLLCLMTGTAMAQEPKVTSLMSKDLAENPGREVLVITVEHAPGGSSVIHRHDAHAFVYVLEGSVVMQLKGGQQVTLTPGQTFYEGPDDVHVVDRNASGTKSAKFLVFLIKNKGAPALVPVE